MPLSFDLNFDLSFDLQDDQDFTLPLLDEPMDEDVPVDRNEAIVDTLQQKEGQPTQSGCETIKRQMATANR